MEPVVERENLEITRCKMFAEGCPKRQCQVEVEALTPTVIVRAWNLDEGS
jgi:hypothetical protein